MDDARPATAATCARSGRDEGVVTIGSVGPVRWSAVPDPVITGGVTISIVAASAVALRLSALVGDRLGVRRAALLRRMVLVGGWLGLAGATWAGVGVRGIALGRWCHLPGVGWFDRRGVRSRPVRTWPHPIWRTRPAELVLADGSVRRVCADEVSLTHLLSEDGTEARLVRRGRR